LQKRHTFAKGSWGGEWHPDFVPQAGDIVVKEHWAQSGFANTDLDFHLKQRGITHVVTVGLLANTCIDSTSRFAKELGYHVTLVRDATAAFSHETHACGARPEWTDIRTRHPDHTGVAGRVAPGSGLALVIGPRDGLMRAVSNIAS
jgi:nicotinamidase-related amidase